MLKKKSQIYKWLDTSQSNHFNELINDNQSHAKTQLYILIHFK